MNLKIRINLIITLILALVMVLGAGMIIDNAREDIRAEVDSTTVLALHLLDAEVLHYTSDYTWANANEKNKVTIFRLQSLDNVRHLRIEFFDALGRLRDSNRPPIGRGDNFPPSWFEKLMGKVSSSLKATHRPIVVNNRVLGELVITPDPSYEIAEIWHDTLGLLSLGLLFFIVVNGVVYWAVYRALRPLHKILGALTQIEHGQLDARLPLFSLPELSSISSKFNAMAQTLESSMMSNHRLTQQLIRLQEDERKNIAHDLHDEIGQHLTAINIDAAAILKANNIIAAHASAMAISAAARQMMNMVRDMLQRLRPAMLEELGLQTSLHELIDTWRQRNRGINISISISSALDNINETIAITAYRIIQECLTNISKHANARFVTIKVERQDETLRLTVKDNGQGFDQHLTSQGFGLAGMRERVDGLGGLFHLHSELEAGVLVEVSLPINFKALS
ncbi:MAG: histidine kinase [Methylotenera sp.]|uniref:histidine kinase n=1 Tax=Methylotenera sp. TaxID=2051956 RepID=UPI0024886E13|nr:histidine kinase [Methylotenera sp.]MDI1308949.1 histidine kinase [Methylotenera sp.]